jgi:hypothetical protein
MKPLILVTGGRGGSDFFQGLLDDHDQILQIPGILRINSEFINIFNSKNNDEISKKFINFVPLIFDSRKNKLERHDKLGKNKNEYYVVSKKKFKHYFNKLNNFENKNFFQSLINLYKAYYLARKKKINKLKLILLHTHTINYTNQLLKLKQIKNCCIIHTMRNPIDALLSPIYNWLKFKNGKFFFPRDLYFQIDLALNGLSDLCEMDKKVFIIQLENLIFNKKRVMKDFCKIFKIKYSNKLLNCTYFGKQWWGDQISGRWLGKKVVNKTNNYRKDYIFSKSDFDYFSNLTKRINSNYFENHDKIKDDDIHFKLMPTKAEILTWKNTIKHKKFLHIISIPYFYLKRIFIINGLFINNKRFNFPYSIGSKK